MSGAIQSISFNGESFVVPDDQEVTKNLGGIVSKEYKTYGGGKTRGIKVNDPGMFGAINIEVDDKAKLTALQGYAALKSVDVSVTTIDGESYGGAGQIIAESGISKNEMTGQLNDEISVVAVNGKFDEL